MPIHMIESMFIHSHVKHMDHTCLLIRKTNRHNEKVYEKPHFDDLWAEKHYIISMIINHYEMSIQNINYYKLQKTA